MKELKFGESERIIYDLMVENDSETQTGLTYDELVQKLTNNL